MENTIVYVIKVENTIVYVITVGKTIVYDIIVFFKSMCTKHKVQFDSSY